MNAASLKAACPHCGMPEQHVGMECGFCSHVVPVPASTVAPDGTARVEEVIGYRGWKIQRDPDGTPWLDSPLYSLRWIPGKWMHAECHRCNTDDTADPHYHGSAATTPDRISPVKDCGGAGHGCGFYAGRTREHLIQLGYGKYTETDIRVIGTVQMQGKVIPATNGWRAAQVRPRVLYVPYEFWELARDLTEVYGPHGVEVEVASTLVMPKAGQAGAIEWCAKCTARMNRRSTTCPLCGHTHT